MLRNEWGGARQFVPNCVRAIHRLGGLRKPCVQLIFLEFGLWKPRVTPIIFLESRFKFHSTTGHIIIMASYGSPMNLDISEEERPESQPLNRQPGRCFVMKSAH